MQFKQWLAALGIRDQICVLRGDRDPRRHAGSALAITLGLDQYRDIEFPQGVVGFPADVLADGGADIDVGFEILGLGTDRPASVESCLTNQRNESRHRRNEGAAAGPTPSGSNPRAGVA